MPFQRQISEIKAKFERLRALDSAFTVGEAGEHEYELNAPANDEEISELENRYRVTLPADYRCFLTQVANGGAGPAYGLFTVQESFAKHLTPHLPFPYDEAKRVPYADSQTAEELKELCAFYDDPRNEHGKLVIGELGCGIMINLIVSGQSKGQVWIDDRTCEWGGLYPFDRFGNSDALTFLDWYELWLDQSLAQIEQNA